MKLYSKRIREVILDPRNEFEKNEVEIEYRKHPLFGFWSRINIERAHRPKQAIGDINLSWVEETKESCPFCPESVERLTPKFDPTLIPEGRIRRGESITFPNLFPFGSLHSISVLCKEHYLKLNQFREEHFHDSLMAVQELFLRARKLDSSLRYANVGMNYLQPAAASLVHPHMQVQLERIPSYIIKTERTLSSNYYGENGSSFWADYLETERELRERYIGKTGTFEWIASYAPLGKAEILGICVEEGSDFLEMEEEGLRDLAKGLVKVLKGYDGLGVYTFNLAVHSWPEKSEDFLLHVHLISRPKPKELYVSDMGFLETLFGDIVVDDSPERVAEEVRRFFS
jgi:galactose-1-phosphate uridylyltransferase